jgi:hypothetical protein
MISEFKYTSVPPEHIEEIIEMLIARADSYMSTSAFLNYNEDADISSFDIQFYVTELEHIPTEWIKIQNIDYMLIWQNDFPSLLVGIRNKKVSVMPIWKDVSLHVQQQQRA